jgi:hypothetical protein
MKSRPKVILFNYVTPGKSVSVHLYGSKYTESLFPLSFKSFNQQASGICQSTKKGLCLEEAN